MANKLHLSKRQNVGGKFSGDNLSFCQNVGGKNLATLFTDKSSGKESLICQKDKMSPENFLATFWRKDKMSAEKICQKDKKIIPKLV